MDIVRPLDVITQSKRKEIILEKKNGKQYRGKLVASDVHPNMVLEDVTELDTNKKLSWIFLRGDNISVIKPAE